MPHASEPATELAPVPPLPAGLTNLRPLAVGGTAAWLVAFLVLATTGSGGEWFWITLAGAGLGAIGIGISEWQRSASRRGSRGAQSGFTDG